MGCRLSKTVSQPDLAAEPSPPPPRGNGQCADAAAAAAAANSPNCGTLPDRRTSGQLTNGQSVLQRRDTPHGSLLDNVNPKNLAAPAEDGPNATPLCAKPISQVESASQADFFKMLDEKIAHGADLPDSDLDD